MHLDASNNQLKDFLRSIDTFKWILVPLERSKYWLLIFLLLRRLCSACNKCEATAHDVHLFLDWYLSEFQRLGNVGGVAQFATERLASQQFLCCSEQPLVDLFQRSMANGKILVAQIAENHQLPLSFARRFAERSRHLWECHYQFQKQTVIAISPFMPDTFRPSPIAYSLKDSGRGHSGTLPFRGSLGSLQRTATHCFGGGGLRGLWPLSFAAERHGLKELHHLETVSVSRVQ